MAKKIRQELSIGYTRSQTKCFYLGRELLKNLRTGEIKLYDRYAVLYTGLISSYQSPHDILIEVNQKDLPEVVVQNFESPYLLINGWLKTKQTDTPDMAVNLLKYVRSESREQIGQILKKIEDNGIDYDLVRLAKDHSKNRYDEYSSPQIEDKLNSMGFFIWDIQRFQLKDLPETNLDDLFVDLVRISVRTNRDSAYIYCNHCCSYHNDETDSLALRISLDGVEDSGGNPCEPDDSCCIAYWISNACVCTQCGKACLGGSSRRGLCHSCSNAVEKYKIKRYHHSPPTVYYDYDDEKGENFIDHGADPEFWGGYGIELEVGNGGEKDTESEKIIKILDEEVYTMHDGSIFNDEDYEYGSSYENGGFEIITFPHTEPALLNMKWDNALTHLLKNNYRSHDIKTCGLHLHISRALFESGDAIMKMMFFYERNFSSVCSFARRTQRQADRWASSYCGSSWAEVTNPQNLKAKVEDYFCRYNRCGSHGARYKCVNIVNSKTVEVRIMRGTLNKSTFWATLDFLINIAKKANTMSWEDVMANDLDKWFEGLKPETFEYMRTRSCFNQPKEESFPNMPEEKEARSLHGVEDPANRLGQLSQVTQASRLEQLSQAVQATTTQIDAMRETLARWQPVGPGTIITAMDDEYPF